MNGFMHTMNLWTETFRAAGWLMAPLVVVSFAIWYSYFRTFLDLRGSLRNAGVFQGTKGPELLGSETSMAQLEGLPGAVPRVARHVILRMRDGVGFREAFAQCRQAEIHDYSSAMIMLGALVAAAPLLGLLGTVLGMIQTFAAVSVRTGGAAPQVADGISQALITTQAGLVAAVPGTFGLAHVYRLYRRLVNAVDLCEAHIALVFEHDSGVKAGTDSTADGGAS